MSNPEDVIVRFMKRLHLLQLQSFSPPEQKSHLSYEVEPILLLLMVLHDTTLQHLNKQVDHFIKRWGIKHYLMYNNCWVSASGCPFRVKVTRSRTTCQARPF